MYQIGVFATGRGQGSRQLLQAIHAAVQSGRLPAKIAFVFSNRDPGEFEPTDAFFALVRQCGYPLVTHSFRKFKARAGDSADWRLAYDREVMAKLAPHRPDLCVLAGYLMIFGPEMCRAYSAVNLHPAAPGGPVGMWNQVVWQLIARRARETGNTMFAVTEELDRGPTVAYSTFPITGGRFDPLWRDAASNSVPQLQAQYGDYGEGLPLFQEIRNAGMLRERPLVVETLKACAEGRVVIKEGRVLDKRGNVLPGLDLTREIEDYVAAHPQS
ncbi:MAG: phosphoglycerate transporter [Dehalococcoidia bacterium]|nr:phosphoglycerate transporter [Dehalococcoidia bacterium]